MSLANTKNGLEIMLGLCGDEFWRVSGGVKYAFYSKKQIDEGKSFIVAQKRVMTFYTVHGMTKFVSVLFTIWSMVF